MVDTHCHIYQQYYDNIDEIISQTIKSGVKKIIVNGCDMQSNIEVLELVNKYDCVYGALGFHPTEVDNLSDNDILWLDTNIKNKKIVAIGEIGLDYHYVDTNKDNQISIFRKQLEIAEKNKKPVIVHSRDAIQDTYDILKEYKTIGSIHCFSGSLEMAREFIKLGFYIGVGGTLTYKNSKKLNDVVKNIDLAYILLETDSPYLPPEGKRGEKNLPSNIPIIAEKISEIKGISVADVSNVTTSNAVRLFDF